jgi:hypothetical protein
MGGRALAVTWTSASGVDFHSLDAAAKEGRFAVLADGFARFHSYRYFDDPAAAREFAASVMPAGEGAVDARQRWVGIAYDRDGVLKPGVGGPGLRQWDALRDLPPRTSPQFAFGVVGTSATVDAGFKTRA